MRRPGLIQLGSQEGVISGEKSGDRYSSTLYAVPKIGVHRTPLTKRHVAQIVKTAAGTPGAIHHRSRRRVTPRPADAVPGGLIVVRAVVIEKRSAGGRGCRRI